MGRRRRFKDLVCVSGRVEPEKMEIFNQIVPNFSEWLRQKIDEEIAYVDILALDKEKQDEKVMRAKEDLLEAEKEALRLTHTLERQRRWIDLQTAARLKALENIQREFMKLFGKNWKPENEVVINFFEHRLAAMRKFGFYSAEELRDAALKIVSEP